MRNSTFFLLTAFMVTFAAIGHAADDGFESIFDGQTLKGWHVSAKSGHSGASKNKSGGDWRVVDGAITGTAANSWRHSASFATRWPLARKP